MDLKPNRWKNSNVPNQQMAIVCLFARWKVGMMIRNPSGKIKQQLDVPSGTSVGNYLKTNTIDIRKASKTILITPWGYSI